MSSFPNFFFHLFLFAFFILLFYSLKFVFSDLILNEQFFLLLYFHFIFIFDIFILIKKIINFLHLKLKKKNSLLCSFFYFVFPTLSLHLSLKNRISVIHSSLSSSIFLPSLTALGIMHRPAFFVASLLSLSKMQKRGSLG